MSDAPKPISPIKPHELPYISSIPKDGRRIVVSSYYDSDSNKFYAYSLQPNGEIIIIQAVDLVHGSYIAKSPANKDLDCRLQFAEILTNHFSFQEILFAYKDAEKDLVNGLGSLHKYFVLLKYANESHDISDRFMIDTEIEYAFGNHRSFYDCLNKIICVLLKKYQPASPELPDSFRKVATKSEQDLATKFLFPAPLIEFYKTRENGFLKLRSIRDNIFHHGHSPDSLFKFDDGFAIEINSRFAQQLGDFNLWTDELLKPNRLGSVLPIFTFLVSDMFNAMEHLGTTFINCFQDPPPPIIKGYQVFLRSTVSKHLISLDKYQKEHWFDPKVILNS